MAFHHRPIQVLVVFQPVITDDFEENGSPIKSRDPLAKHFES